MKHIIRSVLLEWGGKYTIVPHQFEATYLDETNKEPVDTSFDQIDIDVNDNDSTSADVYDISRLKPDEKRTDSSIKRISDVQKVKKVLGAIVDVKNNTNLNLTELGVDLNKLDTLFISMERLNVGDRILVGDNISVENYYGYTHHIELTELSVWEDNVLSNCKVNDDELLPDLFDVVYNPAHTQYSIEKIDKQTIKNNIVIYVYNVNIEENSEIDFREVVF